MSLDSIFWAIIGVGGILLIALVEVIRHLIVIESTLQRLLLDFQLAELKKEP
jgi:hypothetical protein